MGVSATMRCVVLFFAESAIFASSLLLKSGCGGPDFNFLFQYALYLSITKSSDSLSSMKVDQLNQKGNRSNIK